MDTTSTQPLVDRRKFIGGSDIAAILGISPWTTPVALYDKKTRPPREDSPATGVKRRGHRWEAVVAEMLVESLRDQGRDVEIVASNMRYVDPHVDYFACEIDFELRLDGADEVTNCELKTVHPFKSKEWGESGSDDLPVWYTAQAMWGLGITARRECIVAALFGADELKTYPVARDDETIAALRARAAAFWTHHVLPLVPPDPVSLDDLNRLYPVESEDSVLVADDDLTAKILRMRAVAREIKAREAEYESLQFDVERVMKHCTAVTVRDKEAVTWKNRDFTFVDQAELKKSFPKIHRELQRKTTSRVFTLKQFGWE